jgi:hypothetical protein
MKIKFILPLLLLFSLSIFAQGGRKDKRDQVKALKVSFFTTELNLTSDEAAKFWPVYNAFEEKQFSIRHNKMRQLINKINDMGDNISEKDAVNYLNQLEDVEEELLNLRKKLVADLKPIIGPVKVLKLRKAEDDFNKKLLARYKERKKQ